MAVKIIGRVWDNSQAKHAELLIMLALADWSDDAGRSYPSIKKLAQKARLTERQTRRALKKLEEIGEIRRVKSNGGRNRVNQYFITIQENPDKITLTELQGKNNTEKNDQETLVKMSGAYIRQGTVNNTEPKSSPTSKNKKSKPAADPAQLQAFADFYQAYPRHIERKSAEEAWLNLNPDAALTARIMAAVRVYAEEMEGTKPKFIKYPQGWLNARRWEDETADEASASKPATFKDLGDGLVEVDGRRMDRTLYERRYGQAAS